MTERPSRLAGTFLCRLLGHRWNYCCRYAYAVGYLWCERCKAPADNDHGVSGGSAPETIKPPAQNDQSQAGDAS